MAKKDTKVTKCSLVGLDEKLLQKYNDRVARFGPDHAAATALVDKAEGANPKTFQDTVAGRCAWVKANRKKVTDHVNTFVAEVRAAKAKAEEEAAAAKAKAKPAQKGGAKKSAG